MAIQNFDKLNNIATTWYSKMNCTEEEKKRRIDLSLLYADIMDIFFTMLIMEELSRQEMITWLAERLAVVASNEIGTENIAYINDWSVKEAETIYDITVKNIEKQRKAEGTEEQEESAEGEAEPKEITFEEFDVSVPEPEYWTSDIRGILLGMECASAVSNYREMYDALQKGFTRKVWITEADDKVRPTHMEVDHNDIPIMDLFQVGDSVLLFPGDISNGASEQEVCNCRCRCDYY
jgi:hypothetical protein